MHCLMCLLIIALETFCKSLGTANIFRKWQNYVETVETLNFVVVYRSSVTFALCFYVTIVFVV